MPDELLQHVDYPLPQPESGPSVLAMAGGLLERIRSRCYWQALIRPEQFIANRIEDYGRLRPIVRESAVSLRGREFPHVADQREIKRGGDDWVGEEQDWQDHLELWRLYQSGQFVSVLGLWHDWQGRSIQDLDGDGPTNELPLWDTIYRFTEIYEFAARLALTEAGGAAMRVEVKIGNLQERVLVQDNPGKRPPRRYYYPAASFSHPARGADPIAREALVAQPREFAAVALHELFRRFEFPVTIASIRSWQDELDRW